MITIALDLVARLSLQDNFSSRINGATSGMKRFNTAVLGIASAIGLTAALSKGFNMVKSSIDGAIDRYDTLNNFPKIMQQVGFSVEEADSAINRLSDGITGLPTTINGVAASAQQIAVMTKDLDGAVETTLALNNAFISSGSDATAAERGMDQYVKSLSKGKFEMDSWTTLQETMGLALNDVAEAFGYTGKSAQSDLYDALKEGHVTFDRFNGKLIELDKAQGGFAERALTASGGIKTAWKNMGTSVVRGVANIIGKIDEALGGTGSIEEIIGKVRGAIDDAFGRIIKLVPVVAGAFKRVYKAIKPLIPIIKTVASAIGIAVLAIGGFLAIVGTIKLVGAAFMFLFSPIALIVGAIAGLVLGFQAAYKHSATFRDAIDRIISGVKGLFAILSGNKQEGADIMSAAGLSMESVMDIYDFAERIKTAVGTIKEMFKVAKALFSGDSQEASDLMRAAGLNLDQINKIHDFANGVRDAFDRVKEVFDGFGTLLSGGGAGDLLAALGFSPEAIANITAFAENVKTRVGELATYLMTKWEEIKPGIATLMETFTTAKDTISDVFTTLSGILTPIFDALVVAFQIVGDAAVMVFDNIIAPGVAYLIAMFQLMWSIVGPILSLIGVAIGVAFNILKVVWDTILKPVAAWFLGAFKKAFESAIPHVEAIGDAFDNFGGFVSGITDKLKEFSGWLKGIKIPDWVTNIGGKIAGAASYVGNLVSRDGGNSNYHGNDRIPYDGYLARMHKGERILTRQDADEMDNLSYEGASGGSTYNNQTYNNVSTTQASSSNQGAGGGGVTFTGNTFHVRKESDIDDIADQLYRKINAAGKAGA